MTTALLPALAFPAPRADYKMTIGSSHPPVLPWTIPLRDLVVPISNKVLKDLGIPDTIRWTEAYGGALYDFNNTLEGVGDGLADIGWVGSLWEPAKQPLQNVAYYSPFVTGDFRALMEVQDQLMDRVPAFAAEWTRHNTVYLGAQVADTYHLVTKFPVKSLEPSGQELLARARSRAARRHRARLGGSGCRCSTNAADRGVTARDPDHGTGCRSAERGRAKSPGDLGAVFRAHWR